MKENLYRLTSPCQCLLVHKSDLTVSVYWTGAKLYNCTDEGDIKCTLQSKVTSHILSLQVLLVLPELQLIILSFHLVLGSKHTQPHKELGSFRKKLNS